MMVKRKEPAMIITLDIKGDVISVTDRDGKPVRVKPLDPSQNIKLKNIAGHAVLAYTKISNPTEKKCVTYQTPRGPITI